MTRILLAGESWSTTSIHTKGFDSFTTVAYEEGAADFLASFEGTSVDIDFLPSHLAMSRFPHTIEELDQYDAVVLSDIGANSLLLSNSVFIGGRAASSNRLELVADWVRGGGALLMVGGYLSFQGIEAKANYRNSPLAPVLPVIMEAGDDREETPQGVTPTVTTWHPVMEGLDPRWPEILGYQRAEAKADAQVLVTVDETTHPLVVLGRAGAGRTAAVMTDMGPHWLPRPFLDWEGYGVFWRQLTDWLTNGRIERPRGDEKPFAVGVEGLAGAAAQ